MRTTEKGSIIHLLYTSTSRVGKLQVPEQHHPEGLFDLFAILGLVTIRGCLGPILSMFETDEMNLLAAFSRS